MPKNCRLVPSDIARPARPPFPAEFQPCVFDLPLTPALAAAAAADADTRHSAAAASSDDDDAALAALPACRPKRGRPLKTPGRDGSTPRSQATSALFRFFVRSQRMHHRGAPVGARAPRRSVAELWTDFSNLAGPAQYYWTHMFELFRLYERQQLALADPVPSVVAAPAACRNRAMLSAFYYLSVSAQRALVDDWIVERTARARSRRAEQLETCLARRTLAKIRADVLVLVHNIDYVLQEGLVPHPWQGAFEGI